jgi:hypothetical protein
VSGRALARCRLVLATWLLLTGAAGGLAACDPGVAMGQPLQLGRPAPELAGGPWIASEPLTTERLRGRVVLVEFWTYG